MNTPPKPFPLTAFDTLAADQPIGCLIGTLTKLYPPKTGTSSVGAWSLQNGTFAADGIEIPIVLKDRPELPQAYKGRRVMLTATNSGKGINGVYCFDDDYQGKLTRKIKVTATGEIAFAVDDSPAADPPPQAGQTSLQNPPEQNQQQQAPTTQTKPPGHQRTKEEEEFHEARKTINQIANLHLLCMLAVERYEGPAFKKLSGQDMSESQRQAAAASIFIKADREGLTRFMPVVDATKDPRFQA